MEARSTRPPQPITNSSASANGEQLEKAAAEVDRELLDLALARSPRERLRVATRAQRALSKFRPHAPA